MYDYEPANTGPLSESDCSAEGGLAAYLVAVSVDLSEVPVSTKLSRSAPQTFRAAVASANELSSYPCAEVWVSS